MLPTRGTGEADQSGDGGYRFEGLDGLNGTLFPDVLLDHVMAHLTGAEFKVLAYIVRRTVGFRRESDTISLDQICSGVRRQDGSVVDAGTGLSKKTAIAALKGLQDKGVVVVRKRDGKTRANLPTAFALRFRDSGGTPPDPGEASPVPGATSAPLNVSGELVDGPEPLLGTPHARISRSNAAR